MTNKYDLSFLPPMTNKEMNAGVNLTKKIFKKIIKNEEVIPNSSMSVCEEERNEMLRTLTKLNKISLKDKVELRLHADTYVDDSPIPYKMTFIRGALCPDYLFKSILECDLRDAQIVRNGFLIPKDPSLQLFTALIIIYGVMIRKLLPPNFQKNVTIKTAIEYFHHQSDFADSPLFIYSQVLQELSIAAAAYDSFIYFEDLMLEVNGLNLLPTESIDNVPIILKDCPIENRSQTVAEYLDIIQNLSEIMYDTSLSKLTSAINEAIDLGLLDEYKATTRKKNNTQPICTEHSLLNNTKLLKRLDTSEFNQLGNRGKKIIFSRIKDSIKKSLYSINIPTKYKSITKAAEALSILITPDIETFIKNDQLTYNHSLKIKSENLVTEIQKILSEDEKLKFKFIKNK